MLANVGSLCYSRMYFLVMCFITEQNGSRYKQANCSRAGKAFRHTLESSSGIVTPSTQGTHSQPHRFCCTAGCVSAFLRRKLRSSLRTRAIKQQKCPKVAFKTKTLCVVLPCFRHVASKGQLCRAVPIPASGSGFGAPWGSSCSRTKL